MKPLKTAIVSFSEKGGAGIAARRLFTGLQARKDIQPLMVVREKVSWNEGIRSARQKPHSLPHALALTARNRIRESLHRCRDHRVNPNRYDDGVTFDYLSRINPDVVNLQWLGTDFFSIKSIGKLRKPLVLTLQDAWFLTGGCYYPEECNRFQSTCCGCPFEIGNPKGQIAIATAQREKMQALSTSGAVVVSTSRWLANLAATSTITRDLRIEVIPNGVDTRSYSPQDRNFSRSLFGLSKDAFYLLFGAAGGATDPRKGFDLLSDALAILDPSALKNVRVAVFGASRGTIRCPVAVDFVGRVNDDRAMSALYSAADAVVVPSRYEAFSLVTLEAMSCGTPVVAFGNCGPGEIIENGKTGWISHSVSPGGLAEALNRCFRNSQDSQIQTQCRTRAVNIYDMHILAELYAKLYHEVAFSRP